MSPEFEKFLMKVIKFGIGFFIFLCVCAFLLGALSAL